MVVAGSARAWLIPRHQAGLSHELPWSELDLRLGEDEMAARDSHRTGKSDSDPESRSAGVRAAFLVVNFVLPLASTETSTG